MKSFLCLLLFLAFGIQSNAQEYKPMLKEGRVWKVVSPSIFFDAPDVNFTISVEGDTLVNGEKCKKILRVCDMDEESMETLPFSKQSVVVALEKDKKVFSYNEETKEFVTIMDFNLHKGDNVGTLGDCILNEDSIEVGGNRYHRYTMYRGNDEESAYWVEGIGSSRDFWMANDLIPTGNYYYDLMLECYDNGKLIFTRDDFFSDSVCNGLALIPMAEGADLRMYDALGRLLKTPKKGQIYITKGKKNIKK